MGGATRFIMLLSTPFPSLLLHRPSSLFLLRRLRPTTGYSRYLTVSPCINSLKHNLHTHSLKTHTTCQYSQSHPWTEWSSFIGAINHFHGQQHQSFSVLDHGLLQAEDALVVYEEKELSDDFIRGADACLAFARARPELLGLLSKKDIEAIVTNGTPFIFKSALDTARRMRDFLGADGANVLESDKASTVDIMKYILSYASKPVGSSPGNSLFSRELVEASIRNLLCQITQVSFGNVEQNINVGEQHQFFSGYDQIHKPVEQPIQVKRGDWICQKCSFMNFARNMKCLECEEARPKRLLVGGEWECPQCNFFNFGKNIACLRCDCKRPGEVASQSAYNLDKAKSMDRKFRQNENTFDGSKQIVHTNQSSSLPLSSPSSTSQNNAKNMPFVPLPADKFAKQNQYDKPDFKKDTGEETSQSVSSAPNFGSVTATPSSNSWKVVEKPGSENIDVSPDKKPENWFQRVSELHDVKDLSSSTSDEDFPESMRMGKGENPSVVSKKKDRSLTSPAYDRQAAMEQGKNSDFVPFVPFPPGYFAKKDKDTPHNLDSSAKLSDETSSSSNIARQTAPVRTPDLTTKPYNDNDGQQLIDQSPKLAAEQKLPLHGEPGKKASTIRSMKDESNRSTFTAEKNMSQPTDSSRNSVQMSQNQNIRSIGNGKSLEGSAVKETDPLDMSEEAKAERWFRRVAQIKDISELSQIPDEDFPSIMPMRKGVNRFVVSKRKTPLERRLTSPQYRRNLPSMTSDHLVKDDDNA